MKIGIISLGLIGGSLFKALVNRGYEVAAATRNKNAIEEAKKYSPYISDKIEDLKDCNVIFVCSPMSATLDVLDRLEGILPEETIVADVCSLKEFVMNKKRPYTFIGTHPMAGTEHSGFDSSFKEALCLLETLGDIFRGVAALKRCDINLAVGQIACQFTA